MNSSPLQPSQRAHSVTSAAGRRVTLAELRSALGRAQPDAGELFESQIGKPLRSGRAVRDWHDLLLFILAHPPGNDIHELATAELARTVDVARTLAASHDRHAQSLLGSGIAGMPTYGTFSLALLRRLTHRWPDHTALDSVGAQGEELRELLRTLLLGVEHESVDLHDADGLALLDASFGKERHQQLKNLIQQIDAVSGNHHLREHIFSRLQIEVCLSHSDCSTTNIRAPGGPLFVYDAAQRRTVDVPAIIAEPVDRAVRLTSIEKSGLIDNAQTVLATMLRETDPVTHANEVELYELGRGLRIALYSLSVEQRLPYDSYVGFMAFRNGVPLAYGGAWIFPGKSKVGINVFESQRGGESAWFFAQLLRLYAQVFAVTRSEAENYQLGHGNPEGMRTGAYWFYYKLGFRPENDILARLAEREYKKLIARPGYKVPLPLLRKLVEAGLELQTAHESSATHSDAHVDTSLLTLAVPHHIVQRYAGDRNLALNTALRRIHTLFAFSKPDAWSVNERAALELWALPLDMIPDLESWTRKEIRLLEQTVRSKGAANETRHQQLLAQNTRLLTSWRDYCEVLR